MSLALGDMGSQDAKDRPTPHELVILSIAKDLPWRSGDDAGCPIHRTASSCDEWDEHSIPAASIQLSMLPDPFTPPDAPEPELDPGNPAPDAPLPDAPQDAHDLATPEGDNERPPHEPLTGGVPTPVRPRGDQPHTDEPLYPTAY